MTLRAEDFNLKNTISTEKTATESVDMMNQGVEEKDYALYQKGFQTLMKEVRAEMPQLSGKMSYQLFLFDMVSRFVNEVQDIELNFTDKPFRTRIGAAQLFLNPTLEVLSVETGEVVAFFESVDCFKLAKFNEKTLVALEKRRISNQKRLGVLQERIERAEALLADPTLIYFSTYSDFLSQKISGKGFIRDAVSLVVKVKNSDFYATIEGKKVLQNDISINQAECDQIQQGLDAYSAELREIEWCRREHATFRDIFVRLMSQYQVPDFNEYHKKMAENEAKLHVVS